MGAGADRSEKHACRSLISSSTVTLSTCCVASPLIRMIGLGDTQVPACGEKRVFEGVCERMCE